MESGVARQPIVCLDQYAKECRCDASRPRPPCNDTRLGRDQPPFQPKEKRRLSERSGQSGLSGLYVCHRNGGRRGRNSSKIWNRRAR
jgi:hypothetical protein